MAGYFTKLNGYVYEGTIPAGEPLQNGAFVEIVNGIAVKVSAGNDATYRIVEKTTLYGLPAVVLRVLNMPADEFFLVENELPSMNGEEWNEATYELPAGELVRMKRPLPGEEFIVTVSDAGYATAVVGGTGTPSDDGSFWFW